MGMVETAHQTQVVLRTVSPARCLCRLIRLLHPDWIPDPVPRIARGAFGLTPAQTGFSASAIPAVTELVLNILPALTGIALLRFPAVLIGGRVLVVRRIRLHIRPASVAG